MVNARTQIINCVRGWLRTKVIRVRSGSVETFAARVRNKVLQEPEGMPLFVERQLLVLDELNQQIKDANKELEKIAAQDATCRLLMTAPGVGPVTAVRYMTALDDVSRFSGSHAVESYLGLTPGENSSGAHRRRTPITKAGPSEVRGVLVQACWAAWRMKPLDPLVVWAKQVAERRGRQVAIVAMARKLSGILYAMWRDGKPYTPSGRSNVS